MHIKKLLFGTIRRKLFFGFFIILALVVLLAISTIQLNKQISKTTEAFREVERQIKLIVERTIGLDNILTSNVHFAVWQASTQGWEEVKKHQQTYDKAGKELDYLLKYEAPRLIKLSGRSPEAKASAYQLIQQLDQTNLRLVELELNTFQKIGENDIEGASRLTHDENYEYYKVRYYETYLAWRQLEEEVSATYEREVIGATRRLLATNLSLAFLAILAGITAAILTSQAISGPVKELQNATEQLARGNLKTRVNIKTGCELEDLGNSFNRTIEALERVDEERRMLDKAKTRFINITSHELRSPMTPMKAQLQMLTKEYFGKLSEKQRESIEIIIRNTNRLDNIIADFLEISRIEAGRLRFTFKKTDFEHLMRETAAYLKGFMPEKRVKIFVNAQKLPTIEADSTRVSQVLQNLVNNAIKFSKPNGKVEISAKALKNEILFSVKDYGAGISEQDQKKLFQPFFQSGKTFDMNLAGTGMGLAICKGIVEAQNGRIWAESKLGKGSTFFFTMPLKPVKEMKPIRTLFSAEEDIEQNVAEKFTEVLGPMGIPEFEEFRQKHKLTQKELFSYIDSITAKNIINKAQNKTFKEEIAGIQQKGLRAK